MSPPHTIGQAPPPLQWSAGLRHRPPPPTPQRRGPPTARVRCPPRPPGPRTKLPKLVCAQPLPAPPQGSVGCCRPFPSLGQEGSVAHRPGLRLLIPQRSLTGVPRLFPAVKFPFRKSGSSCLAASLNVRCVACSCPLSAVLPKGILLCTALIQFVFGHIFGGFLRVGFFGSNSSAKSKKMDPPK